MVARWGAEGRETDAGLWGEDDERAFGKGLGSPAEVKKLRIGLEVLRMSAK